ncbi:CNNM domain-containing protein [Campylobacter troglodytis]|uniref:CNNM domain-containing protein n=1 Tax=Campylobacter troglodytis TaxID=654363 RepID=UPI00115BA4DB|nr:CNNM domain-containing protein [Campylobacter troglodytis]TQR53173.1 transporter [Campylobacter troglodytis]
MTLLLIFFVGTVLASGICSVFEAVLFSATPSYIESVASKSKTGKILKHLKTNIDNSVGAVLVVNMFANTIGAAAVGAQFVEVFGDKWQAAAAVGMTLSVLYIAEIIPKTLSALYWKRLILPCCYPLIVLYYLAFPFVYVSRITTFFFRDNTNKGMSRDEILALMELAEEGGTLAELELEILDHLIQQRPLIVSNIMIPKNKVFTLNEDDTVSKALESTKDKRYSRIPLVSSDGSIKSIVYRREILKASLAKKGEESLKNIAKELRLVSSKMRVFTLLKLFILRQEHLFLVIDKKRAFVGVVSLEDAIEAVLGVGNLKIR